MNTNTIILDSEGGFAERIWLGELTQKFNISEMSKKKLGGKLSPPWGVHKHCCRIIYIFCLFRDTLQISYTFLLPSKKLGGQGWPLIFRKEMQFEAWFQGSLGHHNILNRPKMSKNSICSEFSNTLNPYQKILCPFFGAKIQNQAEILHQQFLDKNCIFRMVWTLKTICTFLAYNLNTKLGEQVFSNFSQIWTFQHD